MKERPILFSGPMVRALLAGTKTQTRRIAKGVHIVHEHTGEALAQLDSAGPRISCPYGQPGDRLWVRETWQAFERGWDVYKGIPTSRPSNCCVLYAADDVDGDLGWRPSIHMPRWASRITLEITSVRVERLQEISEADALAEGSRDWAAEQDTPVRDLDEARLQFRALWTAINGGESCDANHWVWVVEFKQLEQQR